MVATIWKFPLKMVADWQIVPMPKDAQIVHVADQRGMICVWAVVDPTASEQENRVLMICGTGGDCPSVSQGVHLGSTFQGELVFHIFEAL